MSQLALEALAAGRYAQAGRDLAALGYSVGRWSDEIRHVDPCDCDLDEEQAGDRCLGNSVWCWALLRDEGAHGWSFAFCLSDYHTPMVPT
jgi:hypothetical protein